MVSGITTSWKSFVVSTAAADNLVLSHITWLSVALRGYSESVRMSKTDLDKIMPDADLSQELRWTIYEHIRRRLAVHRNEAAKWDAQEYAASRGKTNDPHNEFVKEINKWADALAVNAWLACGEPGKGEL